MVEAVARHGYADTTLRDLVGLAGVSKTTFYEHFTDKQDCFLSTFDEIVAVASDQIGQAYNSPGNNRERLRVGLATFMELVATQQPAARLVIVDSLSLGTAAVEHRARAAAGFEQMLRQGLEDEGAEDSKSAELTARAIIAGIRRVVYRRLRVGQPEDLRGYVDELLDWGLGYPGTGGGRWYQPEAVSIAATEDDPKQAEAEEAPGWEEPPDSARSRATLTQRERIVRAVAQVATERGYAALSIPAISNAAGVSNQTFYEHFRSKQDAFLAAFDALSKRAFQAVLAAFQGAQSGADDWPEAISAGMRGLLDYIATDRLFARLAFFELPTAGPVALDRADATTERFTAFLAPEALPAGITAPSEVVVEAIGGGMWAVMQHEIAQGRAESLLQLAPELTRIALAPLGF
jgi:AcrR family transcriptional regulator